MRELQEGRGERPSVGVWGRPAGPYAPARSWPCLLLTPPPAAAGWLLASSCFLSSYLYLRGMGLGSLTSVNVRLALGVPG